MATSLPLPRAPARRYSCGSGTWPSSCPFRGADNPIPDCGPLAVESSPYCTNQAATGCPQDIQDADGNLFTLNTVLDDSACPDPQSISTECQGFYTSCY